MASRLKPSTIDDYISAFPPEVQVILERIRDTIRTHAPDATETISYQIPAFMLGGPLVYFAAFKQHIGLYPPVQGDAQLEAAVARYAGEKGNLRFPLDEPIPYALIARIVKSRVQQHRAQAKEGKAGAVRRNTIARRATSTVAAKSDARTARPKSEPSLVDGQRCAVVHGTHAGKSGTVHDIHTSKTGQITITVEQSNGVRLKTLAKNVVAR